MHIKKGDTVVIITGKDKGASGKVLRVFARKEKAIVEGRNFVTKHLRTQSAEQKGGIVKQEAPIHVSNLMFYCPKCNRPVRLGRKKLEDGTKVRFCRRCGE